MRQFELKKKDVNSNFTYVIKIGYCDLEMLNFKIVDPIGYTCGVYGWNSDIYEVNYYTAISEGARPFGNIEPSRELVKKYNTLFSDLKSTPLEWSEFNEELFKLLEEFADEAIEAFEH